MATQRRNPLNGEWIIISPHRISRPWGGEKGGNNQGFSKVVTYLSPGATRSNGQLNPAYTSTFVFPNDFPALLPATTETGERGEDSELFQTRPAGGECHVMCFSPHSDLSLPLMELRDIVLVVEEWAKLSRDLKHNTYVQIFENKGAMVGCSNSHPHCQIWASTFLPHHVSLEDHHQREYHQKHGQVMLLDYVNRELAAKERIVEEGAAWVALVPYWATWPYELLVLPKRHVTKLGELTESEREDLAHTMKRYLTRYDNLFQCSFPYSMGWHDAPNQGSANDAPNQGAGCAHWQLHAHYYPPLLRSATVKKHIAGYEMFAQCQRDLTPEAAAQSLRGMDPNLHYTSRQTD